MSPWHSISQANVYNRHQNCCLSLKGKWGWGSFQQNEEGHRAEVLRSCCPENFSFPEESKSEAILQGPWGGLQPMSSERGRSNAQASAPALSLSTVHTTWGVFHVQFSHQKTQGCIHVTVCYMIWDHTTYVNPRAQHVRLSRSTRMPAVGSGGDLWTRSQSREPIWLFSKQMNPIYTSCMAVSSELKEEALETHGANKRSHSGKAGAWKILEGPSWALEAQAPLRALGPDLLSTRWTESPRAAAILRPHPCQGGLSGIQLLSHPCSCQ